MPPSPLFLLELLHSLQTALLYLAHESLVRLAKEYAAIKSYYATCNLTNEYTAECNLILLKLPHNKKYCSNLNSIILKCFTHITFKRQKLKSVCLQFFKLVLILIICLQIKLFYHFRNQYCSSKRHNSQMSMLLMQNIINAILQYSH
jgi:hypothetical protein